MNNDVSKINHSVPEERTLMSGLAVCKSPRWDEDRLWFSDWALKRCEERMRPNLLEAGLWSRASSPCAGREREESNIGGGECLIRKWS
jgi:hypothetical protein